MLKNEKKVSKGGNKKRKIQRKKVEKGTEKNE